MWLGVIAIVMVGLCVLAWIGLQAEPKPGTMAHAQREMALRRPIVLAAPQYAPTPVSAATLAGVAVPGRRVPDDCPTVRIPVQRVQVDRSRVDEAVQAFADEGSEWTAGPLPETITMPDEVTRYGIADDVTIDLEATPHWLIAGATGTGKSCLLNALLCQMVQRDPHDLRLVLIDPKKVELAPFGAVPHLWRPVATELDTAIQALRDVEREMDRRYKLMQENRARNLDRLARHGVHLHRIVVVADEVGDLMVQAKKRVEPLLMRLTALGRAAGIQVIVATQRPSVDVVTGVLKANLPGRIALRTASGTDSRVILDEVGAEDLRLPGEFICRSGLETTVGRGWWVTDEDVDRVTAG